MKQKIVVNVRRTRPPSVKPVIDFAVQYLSCDGGGTPYLDKHLANNLAEMARRRFAMFGEVTHQDIVNYIEAWIISRPDGRPPISFSYSATPKRRKR